MEFDHSNSNTNWTGFCLEACKHLSEDFANGSQKLCLSSRGFRCCSLSLGSHVRAVAARKLVAITAVEVSLVQIHEC